MIYINQINKKINGNKAVLSTDILIEKDFNSNIFPLFMEVDAEYEKYLVTDRADAIVVGILLYAMDHGHDITCRIPISADLKFMIEKQLFFTLKKYDDSYYIPTIFSEVTNEKLENAGAVGTGISLGLDSFCTIAEFYNIEADDLRLTHLLTVNNGALGGYYQNNNWNYCAQKLLEREEEVSTKLGLPLIKANCNLSRLLTYRTDFFVTYLIVFFVLSLGKLFSTYYVSSNGVGYHGFNVVKTKNTDCTFYDLLLLNVLSRKNGVKFISGGGQYDRIDKLRVVATLPQARENLQSCLTEYYNCMNCMKCRRNLVSLDALGLLDEFSKAYDIPYYKKHRNEYMDWMCSQVNNNGHDAEFIRSAYNLIKKREPEYIKNFELSSAQFFANSVEIKRQRNVYRSCAKLFRTFISKDDAVSRLRNWFESKNIHNLIIYGPGDSEATLFLVTMQNQLGLKISYIVENVRPGQKTVVPRLPENTIEYPKCDAVVVCSIDKSYLIKRKLKDFVKVPVYEISTILSLE